MKNSRLEIMEEAEKTSRIAKQSLRREGFSVKVGFSHHTGQEGSRHGRSSAGARDQAGDQDQGNGSEDEFGHSERWDFTRKLAQDIWIERPRFCVRKTYGISGLVFWRQARYL